MYLGTQYEKADNSGSVGETTLVADSAGRPRDRNGCERRVVNRRSGSTTTKIARESDFHQGVSRSEFAQDHDLPVPPHAHDEIDALLVKVPKKAVGHEMAVQEH